MYGEVIGYVPESLLCPTFSLENTVMCVVPWHVAKTGHVRHVDPRKKIFFSFPKTTRVNELKIFDFGWWVGFFAPEDDGKAPVAFHSVVVHAPVVTLWSRDTLVHIYIYIYILVRSWMQAFFLDTIVAFPATTFTMRRDFFSGQQHSFLHFSHTHRNKNTWLAVARLSLYGCWSRHFMCVCVGD